jgi:BlaI family penicillinase repressor
MRADVTASPTDAELEILHVLWQLGASTVREVHEAVGAIKTVGYTTVLKQMQVMHRKGLLTRSDRFRSHVYEPAQPRSRTLRRLAGTMLEQAFNGSAAQLLQSALAGRKVGPEELDEIHALLETYKGKVR